MRVSSCASFLAGLSRFPVLENHRRSLKTLPTLSQISFQRERIGPPSSAMSGEVLRPWSSSSGAGAEAERKPGMDRFELSPSSVLKLQKGDITKWFVDGSTDAIVNAANERLRRGGGVDGAIHRAAGPELQAACLDIAEVRPGVRCPTGEARITPAFQLPVSRIIHTVGPIYNIDQQPGVSLRNAYRNSLQLAKENNIQYIAFPSISCGVYRYPFNEASRIAISTIKEFSDKLKEVHFVLFDDEIYRAWLEGARELL